MNPQPLEYEKSRPQPEGVFSFSVTGAPRRAIIAEEMPPDLEQVIREIVKDELSRALANMLSQYFNQVEGDITDVYNNLGNLYGDFYRYIVNQITYGGETGGSGTNVADGPGITLTPVGAQTKISTDPGDGLEHSDGTDAATIQVKVDGTTLSVSEAGVKGNYTAGDGINIDANEIQVKVKDTTLDVDDNGLYGNYQAGNGISITTNSIAAVGNETTIGVDEYGIKGLYVEGNGIDIDGATIAAKIKDTTLGADSGGLYGAYEGGNGIQIATNVISAKIKDSTLGADSGGLYGAYVGAEGITITGEDIATDIVTIGDPGLEYVGSGDARQLNVKCDESSSYAHSVKRDGGYGLYVYFKLS